MSEFRISTDERESSKKRGVHLRPRKFTQSPIVVNKHVYVSFLREKPDGTFEHVFERGGFHAGRYRNKYYMTKRAYGAIFQYGDDTYHAAQLDEQGYTWKVRIPERMNANEFCEKLRMYGLEVYFGTAGRVYQAGNRSLMGEGKLGDYAKELREQYRVNKSALEKMLAQYLANARDDALRGEQPFTTRFSMVEWYSEEAYTATLEQFRELEYTYIVSVCGELKLTIENLLLQIDWTQEHIGESLIEFYTVNKIPLGELCSHMKTFQEIAAWAIPHEDRAHFQELCTLYNRARAWRQIAENQVKIRYCTKCKRFSLERQCTEQFNTEGEQEFICPTEKCNNATKPGVNKLIPELPAIQKDSKRISPRVTSVHREQSLRTLDNVPIYTTERPSLSNLPDGLTDGYGYVFTPGEGYTYDYQI